MSDSLRDIRLKHWLNNVLSDDNQPSCPSVLSLLGDKSTGKIIDFKKLKNSDPFMYRYWQRLQKQRKLIQIIEEPFLDGLSPDLTLSDDDQSTCRSDLSLRSDWSNGAIIDIKKLEESHPRKFQRWESLQELREEVQFEEERFLSRLPSDLIIGDDNQSSCPSVPSLRSDWSKDKTIDFKKLEENDPIMYQIWRSLQELREDLQIQERQFARLSSDLILNGHNISPCLSEAYCRSDWSNEFKDFNMLEKSDPFLDGRWKHLQKQRTRPFARPSPYYFPSAYNISPCRSVQILRSDRSRGKKTD